MWKQTVADMQGEIHALQKTLVRLQKQYPDVVQLPSLFSMSASGTGDRIKTDSGWKENLSRIAEAHPNTPLGDKYNKKSTKDIKTRQVLKKHGVL